MTPDETKNLLAKAALIDNRTVDLATIAAWHEAIGHLEFHDAMKALTLHRQRSADYLMPSHIIHHATEAKRLRETAESTARAHRALPPSPVQPMPKWFSEWRKNFGKERHAKESAPFVAGAQK